MNLQHYCAAFAISSMPTAQDDTWRFERKVHHPIDIGKKQEQSGQTLQGSCNGRIGKETAQNLKIFFFTLPSLRLVGLGISGATSDWRNWQDGEFALMGRRRSQTRRHGRLRTPNCPMDLTWFDNLSWSEVFCYEPTLFPFGSSQFWTCCHNQSRDVSRHLRWTLGLLVEDHQPITIHYPLEDLRHCGIHCHIFLGLMYVHLSVALAQLDQAWRQYLGAAWWGEVGKIQHDPDLNSIGTNSVCTCLISFVHHRRQAKQPAMIHGARTWRGSRVNIHWMGLNNNPLADGRAMTCPEVLGDHRRSRELPGPAAVGDGRGGLSIARLARVAKRAVRPRHGAGRVVRDDVEALRLFDMV